MTDQTILDLFWQRSEDAIRCTAEKYGAYLMKIAMNILRQNEESEECVSDTYLSAWEQIPPDCPQRLLPYLGRITRCHALNRWDYLTAQKRNPEFCVQLEELADVSAARIPWRVNTRAKSCLPPSLPFCGRWMPGSGTSLSGVIGSPTVSRTSPGDSASARAVPGFSSFGSASS